MESKIDCRRFCISMFYISIVISNLLTLCDARSYAEMLIPHEAKLPRTASSMHELVKKLKVLSHLDTSTTTESYSISSPFSLPPFDSIAPVPSPDDANTISPPFSVYPPFTPQPPSTTIPSPTPPPPPPLFNPTLGPYPSPSTSPPAVPNPPNSYIPSPPQYSGPSPPQYSGPRPPFYLPPIVFPPPAVPPPHHKEPQTSSTWCVAKPTVPDPIIQEAMDYACGSGADCKSIQPNGSCYKPDTLLTHASYAFNNYWQNTKVTGGTCDFGGTAMLVTVDPSFEECHFIYN